jgi:hypothetical protein
MVQTEGMVRAERAHRFRSAEDCRKRKGLLADFKIIATEVAGRISNVAHSRIGEIGPRTNGIGCWR